MPVEAEKEISKLWKNLHGAQAEIGKTYYRWRQVAVELAADGVKPMDVALKAAEIFGKDIGKSFLPRMNWLKGEEGFMLNLGKSLAGLWITHGGIATLEKGAQPGEIFVRCTRDPWPTWAKEFGVPMQELVAFQEKMYQTILEDVSVFMNIALKLEMQKSIARGEGETLLRVYKTE